MAAVPVASEHLLGSLRQGCEQMQLPLPEATYQRLVDYIQLLDKWNRAYNLTAIRDIQAMVPLHLLDSLSILPHVSGQHLVDVGTGAGLPGIPLAICRPEQQITLLDSNGKKTRFLFQVKQALGLANVTVVHSRVEAFRPEVPFAGVVSRAFASIGDMIAGCRHLIGAEGSFYAMKGVFPQSELSVLEKPYIVWDSHSLDVPGVEGERCLLVIRQQQEKPL